MPVNMIMPPASAPNIACTDEPGSGRGVLVAEMLVEDRQAHAERDRDNVAASTGTHIAELARCADGTGPGGTDLVCRPSRRTSISGGTGRRVATRQSGASAGRAAARQRRQPPAPTNAAAVELFMSPPSTATVVIATTSGSCVAVKNARATRSPRSGSTRRYSSSAGVPRTTRKSTKKIASSTTDALANSASTSSRMPLTTKTNGTKKPNATAVSLVDCGSTAPPAPAW